jgi:hypothetical protein
MFKKRLNSLCLCLDIAVGDQNCNERIEKLKIYATSLKWGHAREVISRMWTVRRLNDDLSSLTKITTNNEVILVASTMRVVFC